MRYALPKYKKRLASLEKLVVKLAAFYGYTNKKVDQ